jgi:hypothetical protein
MWKPKKTVGQMVEEAKTRIENLSVEQLEAEMARGGVQVVDIRDVRERRKLGFIPGSTHVPRGMLEFWLDPTSHHYTGKIDPKHRRLLRRRPALRARGRRAPRDGIPQHRASGGRLQRLGLGRAHGRAGGPGPLLCR